jgi:hypothetical protein
VVDANASRMLSTVAPFGAGKITVTTGAILGQ